METLYSVLCWLGTYSSTIIALCALVFTAYQAVATRKHNKLSVKPHLTTFSKSNPDSFTVQLSNNGLGPAIIRNYVLEFDNKPYEFKDSDEATKYLRELLGDLVGELKVAILINGHAISAKDNIDILDITYKHKDHNEFEKLKTIIKRMALRVEYQSIYGNKFTYHSTRSHT